MQKKSDDFQDNLSELTSYDIQIIRKHFLQITKGKQTMTKQDFQESLGIINISHSDFLVNQLYKLIDCNGSQQATFDDFFRYSYMFIFGSSKDKAQQSFKILDLNSQNYITIKDVKTMIEGIVNIWNHLNGAKVIASQEYIEFFFSMLDTNNSGKVTKEQFLKNIEQYSFEKLQIYEFLNSDENDFNKKTVEKESDQQNEDNKQTLKKIVEIEKQLQICVQQIMQSNVIKNANLKETTQGPQFQQRQMVSKNGDNGLEDEEPSMQLEGHIDFEMAQTFMSGQDGQYDLLWNRIEAMQKMIVELKKELISTEDDEDNMETQETDNSKKTKKQITGKSKTKINFNQKNQIKSSQVNMKNEMLIQFGHQNWNLAVNMMIGIRKSLNQLFEDLSFSPITDSDYDSIINFDLNSSNKSSLQCQFSSFSSRVFESIRNTIKIQKDEFKRSIGPEQFLGNIILGNLFNLTEQSTTGKSGQFFYYTQDCIYNQKQLIIQQKQFHQMKKIIFRKCLKNTIYTFHKILIHYYQRLYRIQDQGKKTYFIVMQNIFKTNLKIEVKYDLKGSTNGRQVDRLNWDPSIAKKDLDFLTDCNKFQLQQDDLHMFKQIIEVDSQFLKENKINNYSLVIGIHNKDKQNQYYHDEDQLPFSAYDGGIQSKTGKQIFYIGIIDILTQYTAKKKTEYLFKKAAFGEGFSCVPPDQYQTRFLEFITKKVFE